MNIRRTLNNSSKTLQKFFKNKVNIQNCTAMAELLSWTFERDKNVFICGNGGSHCDAMHFAEELTGRFNKTRSALGCLALGDASHMTCVANDFSFEDVFSRQLSGLGKHDDVLVVLSTSGNSQNLINAVNHAKSVGLYTIGLLGKDGGKLRDLVDHKIVVESDVTSHIQEVHMAVLHAVVEGIESLLFPELQDDYLNK